MHFTDTLYKCLFSVGYVELLSLFLFNYVDAIKVQCSSLLALFVSKGGKGISGPLKALSSVFLGSESLCPSVPQAVHVPVPALLIDLWRVRAVLTYGASAVAAVLVSMHGMNCKGCKMKKRG